MFCVEFPPEGIVMANSKQGRIERKLAAVLAADVAGYSRLMGADEAGTARALREHRAAIDPVVASHGGRIVKTTGDGLLLEFPSIVAAVECAVVMQNLMAERNADVPDDRRMLFRIGINLGDVLIEGDDILGDGVNVAARLEGIAEPGGIYISDAAQAVASLLSRKSNWAKTSPGQPDALTGETVSSVGPRVPGRGGSNAPRPSLSARENSLAVDLFRRSESI